MSQLRTRAERNDAQVLLPARLRKSINGTDTNMQNLDRLRLMSTAIPTAVVKLDPATATATASVAAPAVATTRA